MGSVAISDVPDLTGEVFHSLEGPPWLITQVEGQYTIVDFRAIKDFRRVGRMDGLVLFALP